MELKHGSVWDLIHLDDLYVRNPSAADTLFLEMLQALDYVEFKGLIHRDVKPENILYTPLPNGSYRYQLTDFGLCNAIGQARSYAGTKPYAAPELFNDPGSQQTSKMDVWSLAVTLIYAMNAGGFREKPSQPPDRRNKAVQEAVSEEDFRTLRDMVHIDPNQRASPGDMLDKLFNGAGRSTPRNLLQSDIVLVAPLRPQVQPIAMSIDTPEQSVSPVTKPPEQAIQRVRKMHTRLGARSGTRRHNATTSLGPQRSFGRARRA